jgi:selenide,water dikinase
MEALTAILRGGAEKVLEAGAVVVGGHTIVDAEPKYGLAVTGLVHPERIFTKGGAQPGDALLLSKPLGAGTITTALKRGVAEPAHVDAAMASMSRLNRDASRLARQYAVHAMTDITGYSLMGHGHEMAQASGLALHVAYGSLRWLPGAHTYAEAGVFPGGMQRNRAYYQQWVRVQAPLGEAARHLLYDPQTSGGLLLAVAPHDAGPLLKALLASGHDAARIGWAQAGEPGWIIVEN